MFSDLEHAICWIVKKPVRLESKNLSLTSVLNLRLMM